MTRLLSSSDNDSTMSPLQALTLKKLSHHPNVVRMYGVSIMPPSLAIVMELCKLGSLRDRLDQAKALVLERFRNYSNAPSTDASTVQALAHHLLQKYANQQSQSSGLESVSGSFTSAGCCSVLCCCCGLCGCGPRDHHLMSIKAPALPHLVYFSSGLRRTPKSRGASQEPPTPITTPQFSLDSGPLSPLLSQSDPATSGDSSGPSTETLSRGFRLSSLMSSESRGANESFEQRFARESKDVAERLLDWEFKLDVARQCTAALNFFHTQKPNPIIHMDVKSEQFLLTYEPSNPFEVSALCRSLMQFVTLLLARSKSSSQILGVPSLRMQSLKIGAV